jgi:hypothetical protein
VSQRALDLHKLRGATGTRTPDFLHAIPDDFVRLGSKRSRDLRLPSDASPTAPDSTGCGLTL